MFPTPMLPLVCVAKELAALVLFEVSAASVVVALNVVPAEASTEERPSKKMAQNECFSTLPPRLPIAWGTT